MPTAYPDQGRPSSQLRTNLTIVLISWGVFGACWWNAVLGVAYTAYARLLGASPLMLGFLSASAVLGSVAQPFSSYLIERTGRRKRIFLAACLVQRPLWVVVGALPFIIPAPYAGWRPFGLLALTLGSSLLGYTGNPAWVSWMADIIPDRIRARFLGVRFRLATMTGMLTGLVVGAALDWNSSYYVFLVIFGVAALMGTIDIIMFFFVPRGEEKPSAQVLSLASIVRLPWRDRRFRPYLAYAGLSAATYGIMGQFTALYLLEYIWVGKLLANVYLMVLPLLVAALLGPTMGRLISRFGNRPVLLVMTVLAVPLPLMWGAAGPGSHLLLASTSALSGVVTAAQGVADLNMLFALTPARNRSAYIAAVFLVAGLIGAVAPVVGGAIAQALAGWSGSLAGLRLVNLHAVFLVATLLRVVHVVVVVPALPEPEARPAAELLADLLRAPAETAGAAVRRLLGR